jgi:hypothetical protein
LEGAGQGPDEFVVLFGDFWEVRVFDASKVLADVVRGLWKEVWGCGEEKSGWEDDSGHDVAWMRMVLSQATDKQHTLWLVRLLTVSSDDRTGETSYTDVQDSWSEWLIFW